MASRFSFLLLFFVFPLVSSKGTPNVVIEEGYTVTTVIDGHKLGINPHAVLLRPGSSDLIVLDSTGSDFYTVAFPLSKDSVLNRFSGTGDVGYLDGEPGSALFSKPRSFAVDQRGNIYVADRNNNVIRKITSSGVTTIAGLNKKIGREDGPVQNATFSNNFEVVFVAEKCVLLVADHGSQLVRQIDLKAEDCVRGSKKGMSAVSTWAVTMGLVCIMCFFVGLAVRPYLFPHEGIRLHRCKETWRRCLIHLEKLVRTPCFAIRSAIVDFSLVGSLLRRLFWLCSSYLSLLLTANYLSSYVSSKEQVSLLNHGKVSRSSSSSEMTKSQKYADQVKDLISFDDSSDGVTTQLLEKKEEYREERDFVFSGCNEIGKISNLMKTNIVQFADADRETTQMDKNLSGSSSLVKGDEWVETLKAALLQ